MCGVVTIFATLGGRKIQPIFNPLTFKILGSPQKIIIGHKNDATFDKPIWKQY